MLSWLIEFSDRVQNVCVAGIEMTGPEAVVVGWEALRRAMQEIGIRTREGLAEWIHSQGFPMPRWGAHFCSRAQERMLNIATAGDARVSGLESLFVQLTLSLCVRRRASPGSSATTAPW